MLAVTIPTESHTMDFPENRNPPGAFFCLAAFRLPAAIDALLLCWPLRRLPPTKRTFLFLRSGFLIHSPREENCKFPSHRTRRTQKQKAKLPSSPSSSCASCGVCFFSVKRSLQLTVLKTPRTLADIQKGYCTVHARHRACTHNTDLQSAKQNSSALLLLLRLLLLPTTFFFRLKRSNGRPRPRVLHRARDTPLEPLQAHRTLI